MFVQGVKPEMKCCAVAFSFPFPHQYLGEGLEPHCGPNLSLLMQSAGDLHMFPGHPGLWQVLRVPPLPSLCSPRLKRYFGFQMSSLYFKAQDLKIDRVFCSVEKRNKQKSVSTKIFIHFFPHKILQAEHPQRPKHSKTEICVKIK